MDVNATRNVVQKELLKIKHHANVFQNVFCQLQVVDLINGLMMLIVNVFQNAYLLLLVNMELGTLKHVNANVQDNKFVQLARIGIQEHANVNAVGLQYFAELIQDGIKILANANVQQK